MYNKKKYRMIYIIVFIFFTRTIAESGFGVDLINVSLGSWITTHDNSTGSSGKDSYFNSLSLNAYYHAGPIKGYIGLPAQLTFEKYPTKTNYSFYLIDLAAYIGKNIGMVEPRLGMVFPLGYPTDDEIAWTGSGNIKGIVGLGFNLGEFTLKKIWLGGEFMSQIYLTGLDQGARVEQGSVSWYLSIKGSLPVNEKFKTGIELFPHGSYFVNTDWGEKEIVLFGFLPILFISYSPVSRIELSLKGGFGPTNTDSKIIYAVLSTTVYTW